ncbi:MAG: DoxX family protein [Phycisphaeraceae bacterium]|nr:DoxX family protein [Phycisphaeraceae bacterium]
MGALRTCLSTNLTPLLLRLALGLTFLWAGWGKVMVRMDFAPEQLARLANMGVDRARVAAATPGSALPDPGASREDALPHAGRVILAQGAAPGRVYTPADFSGPAQLPGLYGLALFIQGSATADKPTMPATLGRDAWPVRLAHAAAWTELIGGAFLLVGLFTPLAGFAIACVMGTALWMTQIGPATVGGGPSTLWFLPPINNFAPGDAGWSKFLWQLLLMFSALSLVFGGAGAVSVDRWIFGSRGSPGGSDASYNSDDDEDDED